MSEPDMLKIVWVVLLSRTYAFWCTRAVNDERLILRQK